MSNTIKDKPGYDVQRLKPYRGKNKRAGRGKLAQLQMATNDREFIKALS